MWLAGLLFILGCLLLVAGMWTWSPAAGLITLGLLLAAEGIARYANRRNDDG